MITSGKDPSTPGQYQSIANSCLGGHLHCPFRSSGCNAVRCGVLCAAKKARSLAQRLSGLCSESPATRTLPVGQTSDRFPGQPPSCKGRIADHFRSPRAGRRRPEESVAVPASERIGGQHPLPTGPFGQVTRVWQRGAGPVQHRVARRPTYSI